MFFNVLTLPNPKVFLTYQTAYLDYLVNPQLHRLDYSLTLLSRLHNTLPLGN